jgi:cyclophilin family peptidyl-prolyl cis-trans isomerase
MDYILRTLLLCSLGAFMACHQQTSTEQNKDIPPIMAQDLQTEESGLSKSYALLKTVYGTSKIKFYTKEAPNTSTRIIELIKQGFYNNLVFHRVIPGFVAQTGDPTGAGNGGSGKKLKAEFNKIKHEKSIIGMARTQDPNSADSQFYICLGPAPHLDEKYTVFAKVVLGMEFIEQIKQGDKIIEMNFHSVEE